MRDLASLRFASLGAGAERHLQELGALRGGGRGEEELGGAGEEVAGSLGGNARDFDAQGDGEEG